MIEPSSPVILSVNTVAEGKFIAAGDPTPFEKESELPESLKPFVARGDEEFYSPSARNIYPCDLPPRLQREAMRAQLDKTTRSVIEAVANAPLRPDIAEALQSAHDKDIGRELAQARYAQELDDGVREQAKSEAEPREFFVKRGGEYGLVSRCKLKPGELLFIRTPVGEYEAAGHVNAQGEIPDELTYDL